MCEAFKCGTRRRPRRLASLSRPNTQHNRSDRRRRRFPSRSFLTRRDARRLALALTISRGVLRATNAKSPTEREAPSASSRRVASRVLAFAFVVVVVVVASSLQRRVAKSSTVRRTFARSPATRQSAPLRAFDITRSCRTSPQGRTRNNDNDGRMFS